MHQMTAAAEQPALAARAGVLDAGVLEWIEVCPDAPYFQTGSGAAWTPIGANEAVSWRPLKPLFRRRDLPAVRRYLADLAASGVTVLRIMLECAQGRHRYLERPAGRFVPAMVQLWDDLFALCEELGLRLLLTPVDTFWTWERWAHHPWNRANGGMLDHPSRMLTDPGARAAIKARLGFAVERWGGSGALFAWDLWNEIHPAQCEWDVSVWPAFIADLSQHVRSLEQRLYGRSHPQTVSLFGPELWWRPELDMKPSIFRHPDLDFATIHIYREHSIDDPRDTVTPALAMGRLVTECLGEITDERPFLDTEHGPIHSFKDRHITLPAAFDDEYFRHMAWAHLASGGAGGGMRWPNRNPHELTGGMRAAQAAMSRFLPLIDWRRFRRRNWSDSVRSPGYHSFACGDERQALVYLLRCGRRTADGRLDRSLPARTTRLHLPHLPPGRYRIAPWDTLAGAALPELEATAGAKGLRVDLSVGGDLALAIVRQD